MSSAEISPGRLDAIRALSADAVTREVVLAMRARDIEPVLLKGPTTAAWLYQGQPRSYNDSDLLVGPCDQHSAAVVLGELGFGYVDTGTSANERDDHSRTFVRDGLEVDLHYTLSGAHVEAGAAWAILTEELSSLDVAGLEVATLGPAARTLHLVLHAADSGGHVERTSTDLQLAIAATDSAAWPVIADLARRLDALPAFAAGLMQVGQGRALLAKLDVVNVATEYELLRATNLVPGALGMARLLSLPASAWPRELTREIAPSPAFMRSWSNLASRGPVGLLLAYLYRPIWLVSRILPAYAEYRRARRTAR